MDSSKRSLEAALEAIAVEARSDSILGYSSISQFAEQSSHAPALAGKENVWKGLISTRERSPDGDDSAGSTFGSDISAPAAAKVWNGSAQQGRWLGSAMASAAARGQVDLFYYCFAHAFTVPKHESGNYFNKYSTDAHVELRLMCVHTHIQQQINTCLFILPQVWRHA
jgi:hypothetical protein